VKLHLSLSESYAVSTWCVHASWWPQKASWTVWFGAMVKEMWFDNDKRERVNGGTWRRGSGLRH